MLQKIKYSNSVQSIKQQELTRPENNKDIWCVHLWNFLKFVF